MASGRRPPQEWQNFEPSRNSVPHRGHASAIAGCGSSTMTSSSRRCVGGRQNSCGVPCATSAIRWTYPENLRSHSNHQNPAECNLLKNNKLFTADISPKSRCKQFLRAVLRKVASVTKALGLKSTPKQNTETAAQCSRKSGSPKSYPRSGRAHTVLRTPSGVPGRRRTDDVLPLPSVRG